MPLNKSTEPHVQLFHARVKRIDQRGVIIVGTEDVWKRKNRTSYRQALWAWPIHSDEPKPRPPDPIDLEEQHIQLAEALRARCDYGVLYVHLLQLVGRRAGRQSRLPLPDLAGPSVHFGTGSPVLELNCFGVRYR